MSSEAQAAAAGATMAVAPEVLAGAADDTITLSAEAATDTALTLAEEPAIVTCTAVALLAASASAAASADCGDSVPTKKRRVGNLGDQLAVVEQRLAKIEHVLSNTPVVIGVTQEVNNKSSSSVWIPIERPDMVFEAMCWSKEYKGWGNTRVQLTADVLLPRSPGSSSSDWFMVDADGPQDDTQHQG
jgi:hypothetical protein